MVARIQGWDGREYRWEFTGRMTTRYRHIDTDPRPGGDAYRLGGFKAFVGQDDHLRHEAFLRPTRIS